MKNNYSKETSEKIQNDIIACTDGILEGEDIPSHVIEKLKEMLCQIIVDNRN